MCIPVKRERCTVQTKQRQQKDLQVVGLKLFSAAFTCDYFTLGMNSFLYCVSQWNLSGHSITIKYCNLTEMELCNCVPGHVLHYIGGQTYDANISVCSVLQCPLGGGVV